VLGNNTIQFGLYNPNWSFSFTPYAWFAAQSSDVGGAELRQSFNDLALKSSDFIPG
jgi:hypothetical protein